VTFAREFSTSEFRLAGWEDRFFALDQTTANLFSGGAEEAVAFQHPS
jgi:hypothetical protein